VRIETSLQPIHRKEFGKSHARHLLQRLGFGGRPEEVRKLADKGLDKAVEQLLDYHKIDDSDLEEFEVSSDLVPFLSKEERKAFREARQDEDKDKIEKYRNLRQENRRQDRQKFREMQRWWLRRMMDTPRPLQEKMALLWHDHFATSYQKVKDTYLMYKQNELFRRNAADNFGDLAMGIVKDPAMLQYLDNQRNRKQNPNENLGRELLELFTLGEGNYTERDIKETARALTGYAYDDDEFVFRENWHDKDTKSILGYEGNYNGKEVVQLLLKKQVCSEFVAFKIYRHLVADIGDDPRLVPGWAQRVIKDMARSLRQKNYDMRPVIRRLVKSRHFYDPRIVGQKIKSPPELVVGTVRSLNTPKRKVERIRKSMQWMGQELFKPPTVAGWQDGKAWINTSTLYVRQNICSYLVTGKFRNKDRSAEDDPPLEPESLLSDIDSREPGRVVNYLVDALLGEQVPSERREPVVRFAKDKAGDEVDSETLTSVLVLLTAMPEYQMC